MFISPKVGISGPGLVRVFTNDGDGFKEGKALSPDLAIRYITFGETTYADAGRRLIVVSSVVRNSGGVSAMVELYEPIAGMGSRWGKRGGGYIPHELNDYMCLSIIVDDTTNVCHIAYKLRGKDGHIRYDFKKSGGGDWYCDGKATVRPRGLPAIRAAIKSPVTRG